MGYSIVGIKKKILLEKFLLVWIKVDISWKVDV